MAQLLHIDSSPLAGASVSRQITAAAAQALAGPGVTTVYRDLAANPIPHLGGELLAALRPAPGTTAPDTPAVRAELALTEEVLSEFLASDVIVVGAPFYNFSIPSQLKTWIDRLAQAGRTFRYTAEGPQGLAGGKRVVIVSSRGGAYSGTPYEVALDHQEAYLKAVFGFFGITDVTVVRAEGLATGPEARAKAIETALADVRRLAS